MLSKRLQVSKYQLRLHRREQPLIGLAIGHRHAGVARALHAAVERDAFVIGPQVLLRGQDLEGFVFLLPHFVDLEDQVGLVVAHLRLMRFEQEHRRRRIFVLRARLVAHGLRHHARLLREMRGVGVIEIIRVLERVAEHEGRIELAVDVDHAVEVPLVELERIVVKEEEELEGKVLVLNKEYNFHNSRN